MNRIHDVASFSRLTDSFPLFLSGGTWSLYEMYASCEIFPSFGQKQHVILYKTDNVMIVIKKAEMDRDLADRDVWHDCFLSPLQIGGGLHTVMPPLQLKRKEGHLLIQPLPHPFKIKIKKYKRFTHITCLHKPKTSWVFLFFVHIFAYTAKPQTTQFGQVSTLQHSGSAFWSSQGRTHSLLLSYMWSYSI